MGEIFVAVYTGIMALLSNLGVNGWIGIFTFALVIVGGIQARIYASMHKSNKAIERAYVKMSHNRPGLIIDDLAVESASTMTGGDGISRQDIRVNVKVQNAGNTPATVTYRLLQLVFTDNPLPNVPAYNATDGEVVRVHLVKNESFNVFVNWNVEAASVEAVRSGGMTLYMLGYVDYIDKFGERHRSGYARAYNPSIDARHPVRRVPGRVIPEPDREAYARRNNLPFVTQPGYNYDRERKKGEGNDWDEPQE